MSHSLRNLVRTTVPAALFSGALLLAGPAVAYPHPPIHPQPPAAPHHTKPPTESCGKFTRTTGKRFGFECWDVHYQRRLPHGFRLTSFKLTGTEYVWGGYHAFHNVVVIFTGKHDHQSHDAFLGNMSLGDSRHINLFTDDSVATVEVHYVAYTMGFKYPKSRTLTLKRPAK